MTSIIQPRSEGAGGLFAWVRGSGPALILIHGVGLQAGAWKPLMPLLAADHTVHAIDLPGHGKSPLQRASSLTDYADRVAQYIAFLGGPVALVGHSLGALISLDLAIKRPHLIRSVCALNAVFERSTKAAQAVQARAQALAEIGKTDPSPTLERWFGKNPTGALQDAATSCRDWLTSVDTTGYAQAYKVFAYHDGPTRVELDSMQRPVLFMTGADDPNSTPEMSIAMAKRTPLGSVQIIDGAAHMAPVTHPTDIAAAIIPHVQKGAA